MSKCRRRWQPSRSRILCSARSRCSRSSAMHQVPSTGENTSRAISTFQRDRNLPETGELSPELFDQIEDAFVAGLK
ncbi:peptidoglycan-binding domain-containing protein [Herbaspirillum sp.]|uniref:peptidoglycan-binding domain-containing protein n=1 Tax=Herbaspirillum sp. TaxID=1890675 RepID=UPI00338F1D93